MSATPQENLKLLDKISIAFFEENAKNLEWSSGEMLIFMCLASIFSYILGAYIKHSLEKIHNEQLTKERKKCEKSLKESQKYNEELKGQNAKIQKELELLLKDEKHVERLYIETRIREAKIEKRLNENKSIKQEALEIKTQQQQENLKRISQRDRLIKQKQLLVDFFNQGHFKYKDGT